MIDFWAQVDETDVENFAKTLVLPSYMSHLKISPFSLSDQVSSATGREPLTILYVGDGRLEELTLTPERNATGLLASLDAELDVEKIRIPETGAVWTWNEFGPTNPFYTRPIEEAENCENAQTTTSDALADGENLDANAAPKFLRVYFELKNPASDVALNFDAKDAYVSVSRCEIFLSWNVFKTYLLARCAELTLAPPTPNNDERNEEGRVALAWNETFRPFSENYVDAKKKSEFDAPPLSTPRPFGATPRKKPTFRFKLDGQNTMFRFGKLAGKLVVTADETLDDVLRFAGLKRSLKYLAEYVRYSSDASAPRVDASGVRLKLTSR